MKTKFILIITLMALCNISWSQMIEDFNSSTAVPSGWTFDTATGSISTAGSNHLVITNGSVTLSRADLDVSNIDLDPNGQNCLAIDYKVLNDLGTNESYIPYVEIWNGLPNQTGSSGYGFLTTTELWQSSDWYTIYVPLYSQTPGCSPDGFWPPAPPGSLDSVVSGATTIRFPTNSNAICPGVVNCPGLAIGIDNIRLVNCNNGTIPTSSVVLNNGNPNITTCNSSVLIPASVTTGSNSTYIWQRGADLNPIRSSNTNSDFYANQSELYTLTVRDENLCEVSDDVNVSVSLLYVKLHNDILTCYPVNEQLSPKKISGATSPTYQWFDSNGQAISGATSDTYTATDFGTYTLEVKDNGCTKFDEIKIKAVITNFIADAGPDVEHCGVGPVNLSGTVSGGFSNTEKWIFEGSTISNSQTCLATESGTYTYEVTDINGCITFDDVLVTIRDINVISGPSINTCNQDETFTAYVSSQGDDPIYARIYVHSDPNKISIPNSESVITGPCPQLTPCATSYTFNAPHPYEKYVLEVKQGNCIELIIFEVEINELSLTLDDIITCDFPNFEIDQLSGINYSGNILDLVYQWDLPDGTSSGQMPLIVNQAENTVETYTLTVSATGTNCTVTQEFDLTHFCDDPCITFEEKQALFQKELANSNGNNRIFSTKIFKDEIYSLHLDVSGIGSCGGMTLVSVTDLSGEVLRSKRYSTFNGTCVYPKEVHVLDEGIFVLANKGSWDNTAYSWKMGAVLIKIDPVSLDVIWTKEYYMNPADDQQIYSFDEGIFINAFSPKYNEGELMGFVMVGNTRRKPASSHLRMNSYFMTVDASGNTIKRKEFLTQIPCKECAGDSESHFAVDISDQVNHSDYEYAVLLESRSKFTGNLTSNQGIKMSYVFLDWDLNINQLASSNPQWYRSIDTKTEANPRKISYESREDGGQLVVKIAGQYMDYKKGFITQFDNYFDSGSNLYSLYNVSQYSTDIGSLNDSQTFDGIVDFVEKDDLTYVLSNGKIIALDMSGGSTSMLNQSPQMNFPIYITTEFGWTGGYIGGLLHEHPNSGFLVNGIRTPNYVKTRDDLGITCSGEEKEAELSPLSLDEGTAIGYEEINMLKEDLSVLITKATLELESECCSNDEVIKDPCDVAIDVDYEVDCEGNVTINSISVPPSNSTLMIEYYNQSSSASFSIEYPGTFQIEEGAWHVKITTVLPNGCEKTWESEEILVPPHPNTEILEFITCLECFTFQPETEIDFLSYYYYNGTNYFRGEEQCLDLGEHTFEYFSENGCLLMTQTIIITEGSGSSYDISDQLPCISGGDIINGGIDLDPDGSGTMALEIPFDASFLWGFCQPNNGLISGWSTGVSSSVNYPDGPTHIISEPGDFSFTTTLENGCPCTVYGTILPCPWQVKENNVANDSRSEPELLDLKTYKLVPNPSTGIFQIENSGSVDKYDNVSILSITGQLVSEYQNVNASKMYDLSTYRDGIYLIRVSTGSQTKLLKFIIHH